MSYDVSSRVEFDEKQPRTSKQAWPRVAIIILNWNGKTDTLECLESLKKLDYPNVDILVVDNGSQDGAVEAIRVVYPMVQVIALEENLGFVGGNNVGMMEAQRQAVDFVLLLNNDTVVAPDFLRNLMTAVIQNDRVRIAGPLIYYHQQPRVVWSAGGEIDWRRGTTRMVGMGETDNGQFGNAPTPVDFLTGCALLVGREVLERVGLLDERFFAYYEETEWCVRAKKAGYTCWLVPEAKIWHKISPEAREASPLVHYYMTRNRLLFLRLAQASFLSWMVTLGEYGRTWLSWTLKPKWRQKAAQRQAMMQAVADFFRGRFGKANWTERNVGI